ncbi:MAG: rRNA maturation RNase YbeY [Alphaproteobacteria bacterium]|nr:rRNA maturation RNase YbeY [Alphaproteobacteria bacterium]
MKSLSVDIQVSLEDARWKKVVDGSIESFLKTYILAALNHPDVVVNIPKKLEISVVLTNDEDIKELNRDYRGKDKPTNVLSFPQEVDLSTMKHLDACVLLGDIVLSIETIQLEVIQQQKLMQHHLAHLIIHSTLHLIGYDHETDSDAGRMESLEVDILSHHNIPNPYESDTSYMV